MAAKRAGAKPARTTKDAMHVLASVTDQVAALAEMSVGQLQARWLEVFGESARSRNKDHLKKRLAFRIQEKAEGGLSDRAKAKIDELAADAPIRHTARRRKKVAAPVEPLAETAAANPDRDSRLPPAGTGALEDFVIARIREVTADGQLAEQVAHRLAERVDSEQKRLGEKRVVIARTLKKHTDLREKLVDSLADLDAAGRGATNERLTKLADQIEALETEHAEVDRKLRALDGVEADAGFVAQALSDFDQVWDALTLDNRFRLVHALVQRVTVDEAAGTIEAELVELGGEDDMEAAS